MPLSITERTPMTTTNTKDTGATDDLHDERAAQPDAKSGSRQNGKLNRQAHVRHVLAEALVHAEAKLTEHTDDADAARDMMGAQLRELADAYTPASNGSSGSVRSRGLLAQRDSLDDLLRNGVPPVKWLESPTLGDRLFYREALFIVSGHKKSGKSWAMAATALDCVRSERPVVYIDLENGPRLFAKRVQLLGGEAWQVAERLHYVPFPRGLSLSKLEDDLAEVADQLPGAFVVVDSLRGLMRALSPNSRPLHPHDPQDIEYVTSPFMEAVKRRGLTVGVIDHAKKSGSDTDEYSTAGAGAKEAAVDAVYFWTKVERYNRDTAGVVKITATSDREGELDFERYWRVGGQGEDAPFRFDALNASEVSIGPILLNVRQLLADNPGQSFTKTKVRQEVKGDNNAIDRALEMLASGDDPIHADSEGQRPPRYVWDENRKPEAGLL